MAPSRSLLAAAVVASLAVLSAVLPVGPSPQPALAQPAASEPAPDLALVHPDALGFVHVRLAELWKNDAMAEFRRIVEKAGPTALAALDEQFVPKPSTAERVTAVVAGQTEQGEPAVVAVMRFSAPFNPAAVRKAYLSGGTARKAGEKEYFADERANAALHFPDDQTLVVSDARTLAEYLGRGPKTTGALAPAIRAAAGKQAIAAVNLTALPLPPDLADNLPPDFRPLLKAQVLTLTMDVAKEVTLAGRLAFRTEAEATEGEAALKRVALLGRVALSEPRRQLESMLYEKNKDKRPRPGEDLPEAVASVVGLGALNTVEEILADPPLKRDGNALAASVTLPPWATQYLGMSAMSAGLLLPAVQKVRDAASRTKAVNNFKQMAIAIHSYHDATGAIPPAAIVDKKGKKLLSWRVAILPYIEQQALYQQFKLDEPWDSEHNKKLATVNVPVYVDPRRPTEPGMTYYKAFVGKNAGFDWVKGRKFSEFTDGLSNTVMFAAAGDPVPWTKPDDFEFDPEGDLPDFTKPFGMLIVAMFDGSVRTIVPEALKKPDLMKRLIQINDGMVIPDF